MSEQELEKQIDNLIALAKNGCPNTAVIQAFELGINLAKETAWTKHNIILEIFYDIK